MYSGNHLTGVGLHLNLPGASLRTFPARESRVTKPVCGPETMTKRLPPADIFTGSAEDSLFKLRWEPHEGGGTLVVAKQVTLKAKGVSDIAVRQDARVFATAGWDNKIRVFSCKTCAPLAVLQVSRSPPLPPFVFRSKSSGPGVSCDLGYWRSYYFRDSIVLDASFQPAIVLRVSNRLCFWRNPHDFFNIVQSPAVSAGAERIASINSKHCAAC